MASAAVLAQGSSRAPVSSGTAEQVIQEGLRREAERDKASQGASPAPMARSPVDAAGSDMSSLPDESPCLVVDTVVMAGGDAQRFAWLATSTDDLRGRCIGPRGMALIVRHLNARLVEQGFITSRVRLEPQHLDDGRLTIQLHAGRIGRVRLLQSQDKSDDERWGTWINAFPTGPGRLLNVRDIEQGVEQMKRLPSQSVTTSLEPASEADTSDLLIERQTGNFVDRVRGGITMDNSGGPSLGRTQLAANVAVDNALGLNDIAAVSLNSNAEGPTTDHRSQSSSLNYSVPFGYSTFSASMGRSRFAQTVQLTTTQVSSSGDSDNASLKWDHVAWRTAGSKTAVSAELSTRQSRGFLDGSELLVSRRRTTFFETGFSFRQKYANDISADFAIGYKRGVPWLRAQDDYAEEEAGGLTLRPRVWSFSAGTAVPFEQPASDGGSGRAWRYSGGLRGQFTSDFTTSSDQIAIGGRGSVRGFDGDSVLIAENGWTLRNEVSTALNLSGLEGTFYAGVDFGRVWGPSDSYLIGHTLAGAAVGVRGRCQSIHLDVALATPLVMPDGFRTASLSLYASMTYAF